MGSIVKSISQRLKDVLQFIYIFLLMSLFIWYKVF